jgi:ubiquinone/menaquinone biosynthesis C-methylase UbiE
MEADVQAHYNSDNLISRIKAAFKAVGKDPSHLTTRDLTVIDQLHTGGARATVSLLAHTGFTPSDRVLDAGCGIGGSCRLLAETCGCRVTGIDLAQRFIDAANDLTRATGLNTRVDFHQGSVLNMPFEDGSFDAVISQHMLMNIQNKPGVAAEFSRVLKPGGQLILHEIFRGNDNKVHYPVNWAPVPDISFLSTWPSMRHLFEHNGFKEQWMSDETPFAAAWWTKANQAVQQHGGWKEPLNPSLFFGNIATQFAGNMMTNFRSGSTQLIEAVLKKG